MSTITVQLDATAALAAELALLAASLADERPLCTAAAAELAAALEGEVGAGAARTADGWAQLLDVLAERCSATGRALTDAVTAYRYAEAARAADLTAASSRRGPR